MNIPIPSSSNTTSCGASIGFTNDICADGICCFMSIPRKQTHLGLLKIFFRRKNASYGVKLLYTALDAKDIIYNPCKYLVFHLKETGASTGNSFQILLRCGIFGKRYRPYTCKGYPDAKNSFMHDVAGPCPYNEYIAPENYVKLKHTHVFQLYFAIMDDHKLLKRIFPGHTAEETRSRLSQCNDVVKVSAIWNEKPSEYFLLKVPRITDILYVSHEHPKITGIKQAYHRWQGHIESWLEKHYGSKWQDCLDRAIEKEKQL
mgnify:FL=1